VRLNEYSMQAAGISISPEDAGAKVLQGALAIATGAQVRLDEIKRDQISSPGYFIFVGERTP